MGMHMTGNSGLWSVPGEHLPGLIALLLFPLLAWAALLALRAGSRHGLRLATALEGRLSATPFAGKVALTVMLLGAAVHAAIVPTHWGNSRPLAILFVLDVLGFLATSAWLVAGCPGWRLGAMAMLGGTFAGYTLYLLKGWETADVVGLTVTSLELAGVLVLLVPEGTTVAAWRKGRLLATALPMAVVVLIGTAVVAAAVVPPTAPGSTGSTSNASAMRSMPSASGSMAPMTGTSSTVAGSSMSNMGGPDTTMPGAMAMGGVSGSTTTMPGGMAMGAAGSTTTMPPMGGGGSGPTTTMGAMPMGGGSTTTMPAMGGGGSTTTTMPGMGGGGSGGPLSLATTSPAGPITWPMTMGAMEPGMAMATPNCTTDPTTAQQQAAVTLVDQTVTGLARYQSLANAKSDGYVPITPTGAQVVHYVKVSFLADNFLVNPAAIESLVYANTPQGAILVAAMYLMNLDQVGVTPPMPGGCLTEWHIHTNLCFSDANGAVVGETHADGTCNAGSSNHVTEPMLHIWLAPVPGGPLTVDASNSQVVQAAEQLPVPSPANAAA